MATPKDGRKGHYMKPGTGPTRPSSLLSVTVECAVSGDPRDQWSIYRRFRSAWVHVTRRDGLKWSPIIPHRCETTRELWDYVEAVAAPGYRNLCVSPCASDTLTLTDFWPRAEAGGVSFEPTPAERKKASGKEPDENVTRIRRLVQAGKPDIIDYEVRKKRYVWVSGQQYFPCDEESLATSLKFVWPETGGSEGHGQVVHRTARERGYLWLLALQRLNDWWGKVAKAPWGFTCGGLAVGILRSYIAAKTLCTHTHHDAHELEGDGCFGARASIWFAGDVGDTHKYQTAAIPAPPRSSLPSLPGPLVQVDVRSMYPWLLRERLFPQRLKAYEVKVRAGAPQDLTRDFGVLADVLITTRRPEYPFRHEDRIIWPTGTFRTVLTGPELDMLRKDGHVHKCYRMALYQLGQPFTAAAGALIQMREDAREAKDGAWELFAKLLANSMGGKLAQRKGVWVTKRRKVAQVDWGQWTETNGKGGAISKYRAIAGLVWEWLAEKRGSGPYVAAFDYLTAYGRCFMRELRDSCPARSVISQDTDGAWVTPDAAESLRAAGWDFGDMAGQLKLGKAVPAMRFYDARHYWQPSGWTLAGFTAPVVAADGKTVQHTTTWNPIRAGATSAPDFVRSTVQRAELKIELEDGEIGEDGWITPAHRSGSM
jgi:hypothetical protein